MTENNPTIFSAIIDGAIPASIVHRDARCIAFMDIHPMSPGHLLVVPRPAVPLLAELPATTRAHIWQIGIALAQAQQAALGSCAQNFLVNDGRGANQTVPHVHLHVIPRYHRDGLRAGLRALTHPAIAVMPIPVSRRKRARLEQQAKAIASAHAKLQAGQHI